MRQRVTIILYSDHTKQNNTQPLGRGQIHTIHSNMSVEESFQHLPQGILKPYKSVSLVVVVDPVHITVYKLWRLLVHDTNIIDYVSPAWRL